MPKPRRAKTAPPTPPTQTTPLLTRTQGNRGGIPKVDITIAGWEQIRQWARSGASLDQIADLLGIAERTLRAPHLKQQVEDIKRTAWAARRVHLQELMLATAEAHPDRRMAQKLMGPVLGWREAVEVSGPQGAPLELVHSTRDQALHTILEAIARTSATKKKVIGE